MLRLRIASSCDASWSSMERRAGGRHCGSCDKHVHDLTAATAPRATALALLYAEVGMCARIRAGEDGFAVFRKERRPRRRDPRGRFLAAAVSIAAPFGCGAPAAPRATVAADHSAPAPSQSAPASP